MKPDIRVILFDVGGVLVELGGISTMLAWVGERMTAEELWEFWLASPVVREFETGGCAPEFFADELIRGMALPVCREDFLAHFAVWPRALLPGALDWSGGCRRNTR